MKFIRLIIVGSVLISLAAASFPQDAQELKVTSEALLQYLNRTVGWYRQLDAQRQIVADSDETITVNENQRIADQVALLAFEFARAEAESIEKEETPTLGGDDSGAVRYQALRRTLASLDQQIQANQQELQSLEQKLAGTAGMEREMLQHRIAQTQSELGLARVRWESIKSMADFVGGSSATGLGATGIREKIEVLARSIPAVLAKSGTNPGNAAPAEQPTQGAAVRKTVPTGIWGLAADLFALSSRIGTLRGALEWTDPG